jgi:predicted aspartyl protease
MGASTMGKVLVEARVTNLKDAWDAERGLKSPADIRSAIVANALVDSGATLLALPPGLIQQLGLSRTATKRARTAGGVCEFGLFDAVRLAIQGRECTVEVMELREGSPVLIGQIPLESLDFVIDTRGQKLIGNPEHGGDHMYDLF